MLKRLSIILICVLLCSCSASDGGKIRKFTESKEILFEYAGIKYEFNQEANTFTSKSGALTDTVFSFTESGCIIRCGEVSLKTQANSLPHLKSFYALFEAFKYNGDSAVITDDGAYALLIDSSRFLVYYNTDAERIDRLIAETADGVFEYTVLESEETD